MLRFGHEALRQLTTTENTIELVVDNRIRLDESKLSFEVIKELEEAFVHSNPSYYKLKSRGFYPGANEPKSYVMYERSSGELSFPRGAYSRIRDLFRRNGITVLYRDERSLGIGPTNFGDLGIQLREYQDDLVSTCFAQENCLAIAPTGSGKSYMGLALAAKTGVPTLVMLHKTGLLEQWIENACKIFGLEEKDIGVIQGPKFKLKPITIAMQQTLLRKKEEDWEKINSYFGCLIVDEAHHSSAATYLKVVDKFKSRYRIGISADHTRSDGKHFLAEDLFGEVAIRISADDLIRSGSIYDVEVILVETEFYSENYDRDRQILQLRQSGLNDTEIIEYLEHDFKIKPMDLNILVPDYASLINEMTEDEVRNQQAISILRNSLNEGRQSLVLSARVEHCKTLQAQLEGFKMASGLLIGGVTNQEEFNRTTMQLKNNSISIGIGTVTAVSEGNDFPNLDCGVLMTPIKSKQPWNQARGRFSRPSGQPPKFYVMWDKLVFGNSMVKDLVSWNSTVKVQLLTGELVDAKEYLKRK